MADKKQAAKPEAEPEAAAESEQLGRGWPELVYKTPPMEKEPVVGPDGHVILSQDDIDARQP